MNRTYPAVPHHVGDHRLPGALKFLPWIAVGLIAIYEDSPILLVALGIAAILALAFIERVEKLHGAERKPCQAPPTHVLLDGGCFPGAEPPADEPRPHAVVVTDGGSLEHHRR